MEQKKYLDLEGLKHYNGKLKDGTIVVGKAAAANTVPSTGIQWGTDTVPLANMPKASLERCYVVANDTARFALTTTQVQNGDTVKVSDTNKMYFVKDDTKLNNENGYEPYTSGTSVNIQSVDWANVTNKPAKFTPEDHGSNTVTSLTGYTPNTTPTNILDTLSTNDTLNQALSKISKNISTLSQYVYIKDLIGTNNTYTKGQLLNRVKGTDAITSYRVLDDRVSDISVGNLYEFTDSGRLRLVQVIETYAQMDSNNATIPYALNGGSRRYWRSIKLSTSQASVPTWSEWQLCIDEELVKLIDNKISDSKKSIALPFDGFVNNATVLQATTTVGTIVYDRIKNRFLCFYNGKYYSSWPTVNLYGEIGEDGVEPNENTLFYHKTDGVVYMFNKQGSSLDSITGDISRISDQEIDNAING